MFALYTLTNLFGQGEGVGSFGIASFGNDKVRMNRGNQRPAFAASFHAKLVDNLAGALCTAWRILEKATGASCSMWLCRHALSLCLFHPLPYLVGLVRFEFQC